MSRNEQLRALDIALSKAWSAADLLGDALASLGIEDPAHPLYVAQAAAEAAQKRVRREIQRIEEAGAE